MELKNLNEKEKENFKKLTKKQALYYSVMRAKSGVLYIQGKPGIAKSAIARGIAAKMGYAYHDLRLSMLDETDVGLFPTVTENSDGKFLEHVVPIWAWKANQCPTIIHFEELNRAPLAVRNAALQLLLERSIGLDFKFNDNVLMIASGNLGTEDNTDVEEFDNALNGRLIHYPHDLTLDEWIVDFANENVHPAIVDFLRQYPDKFYVQPNKNHKAYATPRSWTFLSDFIRANFDLKSPIKEWLPMVAEVGCSYVGNTITSFISYCDAQLKLTINDVLEDFDKVKESLSKDFKRDKKSELVFTLKEMDILKFNKKQMTNLIKFLTVVDQDERCGYLLFITDKYDEAEFDEGRAVHHLMSAFKDDVDRMQEENEKQI